MPICEECRNEAKEERKRRKKIKCDRCDEPVTKNEKEIIPDFSKEYYFE